MIHFPPIFNTAWAILPEYAQNYIPAIAKWLNGNYVFEKSANDYNGTEIQYVTLAKNDTIAIVSITGAITKYDRACEGPGTLYYARVINQLMADPKIEAVIIKIDSGGGQAVAPKYINAAIESRTKPVIAFISDLCASAAYYSIANADLIVANSIEAQIGCIGVLTQITDYSEYFKKQGINITEIYASQSTKKNETYNQALKGDVKPMQKELDFLAENFIGFVEKHRASSLDPKNTEWKQGATFYANEAKKIGLIDQIQTLEQLLSNIEIIN